MFGNIRKNIHPFHKAEYHRGNSGMGYPDFSGVLHRFLFSGVFSWFCIFLNDIHPCTGCQTCL